LTHYGKLQPDLPKTKDRFNQVLEVIDFKENPVSFFNKVKEISNSISNTPVEDIDWQIN